MIGHNRITKKIKTAFMAGIVYYLRQPFHSVLGIKKSHPECGVRGNKIDKWTVNGTLGHGEEYWPPTILNIHRLIILSTADRRPVHKNQ